MASASVKIIFDTVSGWRETGDPMPEFEITRSRTDDSAGRMAPPQRLMTATPIHPD
jgi:hypothetical protein